MTIQVRFLVALVAGVVAVAAAPFAIGWFGGAGSTSATFDVGAIASSDCGDIHTLTGPPGSDASFDNETCTLTVPRGDTGAAGAVGADGAQGPPGAPGPEGPEGPPGAQGATGAEGPTGPSGAVGSKGDTGDVGPQGAVGPQGPVGPAGQDGAPGVQGPAGADGAVGPQGPAGPQGAPGLSGFLSVTATAGCGSNATCTIVATCPGSKDSLGGGVVFASDTPQLNTSGKPMSTWPPTDHTWAVTFTAGNTAIPSGKVVVYATCAAVSG